MHDVRHTSALALPLANQTSTLDFRMNLGVREAAVTGQCRQDRSITSRWGSLHPLTSTSPSTSVSTSTARGARPEEQTYHISAWASPSALLVGVHVRLRQCASQ